MGYISGTLSRNSSARPAPMAPTVLIVLVRYSHEESNILPLVTTRNMRNVLYEISYKLQRYKVLLSSTFSSKRWCSRRWQTNEYFISWIITQYVCPRNYNQIEFWQKKNLGIVRD